MVAAITASISRIAAIIANLIFLKKMMQIGCCYTELIARIEIIEDHKFKNCGGILGIIMILTQHLFKAAYWAYQKLLFRDPTRCKSHEFKKLQKG